MARFRTGQRGAAALELAIAAPALFTMLFLLLEFARALFLFMTLQDVARQAARAASVTDFSDAAAMTQVRKKALYAAGGASSALPLGGGVDESYLRIDYLSLSSANVAATASPMPATPVANINICSATPNASGCIRFVRVQICQPGISACEAAAYTPMIPLLAPIFAGLSLPRSLTMSPAESLGAKPP